MVTISNGLGVASITCKSTLSNYTGPATGLLWDDETGKISIAPGYHADADGNVVRD